MNRRKSKAIRHAADEMVRLNWKLLAKAVDFKQRQENIKGGFQHFHINPRRIAKKIAISMNWS